MYDIILYISINYGHLMARIFNSFSADHQTKNIDEFRQLISVKIS